MSETDNTPSTAVVVQDPQNPPPARKVTYTPVENVMGIMDSARFEHLGRVATVMARAGLLPETITHEGPANNRVPVPFEVAQARSYLIANQADLWHADPMAVAQCTSLVHGKLMYEGKLVHGIISARLGVDLVYEFGRYDIQKRDIIGTRDEDGEWHGEMPGADDKTLGVRVLGTLPGEKRPRWIAGSVGMWHKGDKSPWGASTAWPRQLRYMGAREWCRAYKPSLMLGIVTDDEMDEYRMGLEVGNIAPSRPAPLHAGFEEQRAATLLPAAETAEGAAASVKAKRAKRQAAAETPKEVEPQPETEEQDDSPQEVSEGHAAPGEVYMHVEDSVPTDDGRFMTFKDGSRFSSTGEPLKFKVYAEHAPEPVEEEERPTTEEGATETGGAQPADPELDTSGPVTDASNDGGHPEEDSGPSAPADDASDEDEEEGEGDDLPPEFQTYIEAVDGAKEWTEVKKAMATFFNTPTFKGFTSAEQNKVRQTTWESAKENRVTGLPDPAADVSAFRLWIEACEEPDTIKFNLGVLERQPDFEAKDPGIKDNIRRGVAARIEALNA